MEQIIKIDKREYSSEMMKYEFISKPIIKNVERIVRNSYHYKIFIYYLKNVMDLNECTYFEGYSMTNGFGVELHHSPITLYEYVYAVMTKSLEEKKYFKLMEVADEVMKLHYDFKVGLVPLNPTVHKLVHNKKLDIHPDLVKGDWEEFYREYQEYASDSLRKCVEDAIFIREHVPLNLYPEVLKKSETKFVQKDVESILNVNISKMLTEIKLKKLELA